MTTMTKILIAGFLMLTVGSLGALAQSLPQRYAGELDVCGKVAAGIKAGKSLESALVDLFLFYSDQHTQTYRSIQRAIVHAAIQGCHYDGSEVLRAALKVDMNLPLLVLSMTEAGVSPQTLQDALKQAGVDSSALDDALAVANIDGHPSSPDYMHLLPPPFEVSGGLGQASPFVP